MYCSVTDYYNDLIYHNQISSYKYFWTGQGDKNLFHHPSFKDILTEEFRSPFFSGSDFNNSDLIFNTAVSDHFLPEYSVLKINVKTDDTVNKKSDLYFSIPSITGEGIFLIDKIDVAFILSLIPSPGLFFDEGEAFVRPCPSGHYLRFFRNIPYEYTDFLKGKIPFDTGCVELKRKKYFITPLFLLLTGLSDAEIIELYNIDKDILSEIKDLYICEDSSFKEKLREDLISLLDPYDIKGFKLLSDDGILCEFKKEFLEDFFIGKSGRWQINRRFRYYGLNNFSDGPMLTKDDIKGLIYILLNKNPGKDDRECLSNNTVLQAGDYLHYLVLKEFRKIRFTFKSFMNRNNTFRDFTRFLQDNFLPSLSHAVKELFISSPLSHVLNREDMVCRRIWQKKIAITGGSKISPVHPSCYGRICPLDIEEGPVFSLTEYGRINGAGILETPYLKIHNNEITGEMIFLTPDEEDNPDEYIEYSPSQMFSLIPLLIPFLSLDSYSPAFISRLKQSLPLKEREDPLIYTGLEERGGTFFHGVNLFCAFVYWKDYEYNTVISVSASRKLTSIHCREKLRFSTDDSMIFTRDNPFYSPEELKKLDEKGFIRTDTYVKTGDILFSSIGEKEDFKEWMKDFSFSPFTDKALCYEDLSEHVPSGISGIVTGVFRNAGLIEIEILEERRASEGDRIMSRHGLNSTISKILPDKEMIFYKDGKKKIPLDIVFNCAEFSTGQILEALFSLSAKKLKGRFKIEDSRKITFYPDCEDWDVEKIEEISGNELDIHRKLEGCLNLCGLKDSVNFYNPLNPDKSGTGIRGYHYVMKESKKREEIYYFSMVLDMDEILSPLKFGDINIVEGFFLKRLKQSDPMSVKTFIYYIRGLGINVKFYDEKHDDITENILIDLSCPSDIKRLLFQISSCEDIISRSMGEVFHNRYNDICEEMEHGLYSSHIFGEWKKGSMKTLQTSMACIKLPCPVNHPLFNNTINTIPVIPFYYRPLLEIDKKIVPHDLNRHYEKILTVKYQIERYEDNRQERKNRKVREFLEKELFCSIHNLFNNKRENSIYPYRDRHTGRVYKSFIPLVNEIFTKKP